jgi:hypothetical protein
MKGDFTRVTFDRKKHFSRVLRQQGRVTVDADDNEQTSILLHYLRTLARDVIGPYAAPVDGGGFLASVDANGVTLTAGRMYVDGILVENEDDAYRVDVGLIKTLRGDTDAAWLYLDVWERHITALDDDSIREVALGGPDTGTRAQVTWQVKALQVPTAFDERITRLQQLDPKNTDEAIQEEIGALQTERKNLGADLATFQKDHKNPPDSTLCSGPGILLTGISRAKMTARVDPGAVPTDPCILSPIAKYRGMENQLYRVEIARGGAVGDAKGPTFKWSRDNGSVATRWLGTDGDDLLVAHTRGFVAGNWVELTDETLELAATPGALLKLTNVEGNRLSVDLNASLPAWTPALVNPRVRRWDQVQHDDVVLDEGTVPIVESPADGTDPTWIDLEDGVQIAFVAPGEYRSGDYWVVPARVATGAIEWPDGMALPPNGVDHHYAPLGLAWWDGENLEFGTCQCTFSPASLCGAPFHVSRPPQPAPFDALPDVEPRNVAAAAVAAPEVRPAKKVGRRKPR